MSKILTESEINEKEKFMYRCSAYKDNLMIEIDDVRAILADSGNELIKQKSIYSKMTQKGYSEEDAKKIVDYTFYEPGRLEEYASGKRKPLDEWRSEQKEEYLLCLQDKFCLMGCLEAITNAELAVNRLQKKMELIKEIEDLDRLGNIVKEMIRFGLSFEQIEKIWCDSSNNDKENHTA